jgi:RimJ/RimL family protein N-acetyltransferase
VPIRSLAPRHRSRILAHLLALGERDRYLRFGYPAIDEQIKRYVDSLDFERDEVFGVFNRRLEIIALAHVAFPRPGQPMAHGAEFGGSVLAKARTKGLGGRLFEHAMLHARNHGADTLYIHALSENAPMLRIARRAGAIIERWGGESEGRLRLPPDTVASQVEAWVGRNAAEFDYSVKQRVRRFDHWIERITGHHSRHALPPAPSSRPDVVRPAGPTTEPDADHNAPVAGHPERDPQAP